MKKLITILLSVLIVLSLAGCSKTDSGDGSDSSKEAAASHKVGIAFSGWTSNPNWLMVSERLHNDYDDKGYEFLEKDITSADDVPTILENFISAGCDIVVVHGLYSEAVANMLPQLTEAGIAVGVVDANLVEQGATYDMMCDEYNTGYALGKGAAEWANENISGKVVAGVLGYELLEAFAQRGRGIRDALNEYLENGSVVQLNSAGDQEGGMTETENMLSANPDMNLVACWNSGSGVGAYEALKAAGWNEKEEVGLFSIDASNDELKGILEGGCFKATMEMDLRNQWMKLFELLVEYADNGFQYPEGFKDEDKLWTYPLNLVFEDRAADYITE